MIILVHPCVSGLVITMLDLGIQMTFFLAHRTAQGCSQCTINGHTNKRTVPGHPLSLDPHRGEEKLKKTHLWEKEKPQGEPSDGGIHSQDGQAVHVPRTDGWSPFAERVSVCRDDCSMRGVHIKEEMKQI